MVQLSCSAQFKSMTATVILPTASSIVSNLRSIIKDYNYWGTSESDSPLFIRRTKSLTDAQILTADAAMRRKAGGSSYQVPLNRAIVCKTLLQTFLPLVNDASEVVSTLAVPLRDNEMGMTFASIQIGMLRMPTESLEFYVQLYSTFEQLTETKVCYVDALNDAFVGLFIIGKAADNELVVAQTLLVQT